MSYFSENYGNISYPISTDNSPGLRNAQLGAIHAVGSYCTLQEQYDGLIVMPTGSGKTAVLMMAPFLSQTRSLISCSCNFIYLPLNQSADDIRHCFFA